MEAYTFNKNFLVNEVYWVTSALTKTKDDPRKHVKHLLIKGGKLTCTDGCRLHHVDLDGFGIDGLYRVLKRTKSEIIIQQIEDDAMEYPDFEDLLKWAEDSTAIDLPFCDDGDVSTPYAMVTRAMEDSVLRYNFVADVLACDEVFTAHVGNAGKGVIFAAGKMVAVVMPKLM